MRVDAALDCIEYLQSKNRKGTDEFTLVVFDLYDIIIDFLQNKHFMEKCYAFEKQKGMEQIVKAVGKLFEDQR